jgi:hypothetical protein
VHVTSNRDLAAEASQALAPLTAAVRTESGGFVIDLLRSDGTVLWPDYASGADELLAILTAEQRYLAEQMGRGSMPGATNNDKATERLRRYRAPH